MDAGAEDHEVNPVTGMWIVILGNWIAANPRFALPAAMTLLQRFK